MNCFIIAALTIDGFIARDDAQISTSWTSAEDKKWFNQRTKDAGVIVMGSKTFATIGRPLPGRLSVVYSRNQSAELVAAMEQYPDQIRGTDVSPKELLDQLEKEKYSEVAICGGSSIYTLFAKSGLVTKLYLTIEPVAFGKGVGLFNEVLDLKVRLVAVHDLSDQTKVMEYDVVS
jgi:dihydrofolate reductase